MVVNYQHKMILTSILVGIIAFVISHMVQLLRGDNNHVVN